MTQKYLYKYTGKISFKYGKWWAFSQGRRLRLRGTPVILNNSQKERHYHERDSYPHFCTFKVTIFQCIKAFVHNLFNVRFLSFNSFLRSAEIFLSPACFFACGPSWLDPSPLDSPLDTFGPWKHIISYTHFYLGKLMNVTFFTHCGLLCNISCRRWPEV